MLFRKVRRRFHKLKQLYTDQQINEQQVLLSLDLDENLQVLRSIYQDCFDVVFRTFLIGGQTKAVLIYIEGLSNIEEIDENVLAPLTSETEERVRSLREMLKKKIHI
ncbi:hypothetical protein DMN50_07525, partial [Priestia megaterium]